MSHSFFPTGYRKIVACILLAAFGPVGILSEGLHVLPGFVHCHKFYGPKFHGSPSFSHSACSHVGNDLTGTSSAEKGLAEKGLSECSSSSDGGGFCPICNFCSMFQSPVSLPFTVQETVMVSQRAILLSVPFLSESVFLSHARAPPIV
ncbi:MAG: hypothetical protein LBQ54_04665 [Planctomycetaceae bacterium]|jgi:hypothetical protein|nr:hypothetical protein [Planctomycetaceae bacterium]